MGKLLTPKRRAALKALRRKHGLGEFRRASPDRRQAKGHRRRRRLALAPPPGRAHLNPYLLA